VVRTEFHGNKQSGGAVADFLFAAGRVVLIVAVGAVLLHC